MGGRGQQFTVKLRSDSLDPVLIVVGPTFGDFAGSPDGPDKCTSLATVIPSQSGTYRVVVVPGLHGSYGDYTLSVDGHATLKALFAPPSWRRIRRWTVSVHRC